MATDAQTAHAWMKTILKDLGKYDLPRQDQTFEVLSHSVQDDSRSHNGKDLLVYLKTLSNTSLKIRVHIDGSYDFQSTAILEVWTAAGWTQGAVLLPRAVGKDVNRATVELLSIILPILF